ncbi:MAG TPA: T9SS type A sorting domain-containing protein [Chitinophagales bacterium]|nr:T9SS type A sorting domain-containing protein [Chitinophagales bacterium]
MITKALVFLPPCLFAWAANAQQSSDITFIHDGKTVYGTFAVPNGAGKFPVIIIAPGSGPNDRNGTLILTGANASCLYPSLLNDTLRPYKELSDALVDSGYAVLRYDKLEYTYTTPASLGPITFHKLWLPVESAISYVKTRNDVDTTRIILIGHSEGSSLIPFIAKNRHDIRALISIAGPRTPLDSLLAEQIMYIAQTCGGNVSQAQAQANQIRSYFNDIRTGNWNVNTPDLFGAPASTWSDYIHAVDSVAINYNLCSLPTLFIGLELDINVPLSELTRFENEITATDDFWNIPGLIHYLTPDNIPHVSSMLTDTIVYWLRQNILTTLIDSLYPQGGSVSIQPALFDSEFSISFDKNDAQQVCFSVTSITGQEIISHRCHNVSGRLLHRIEMSSFPSGIYLANIFFNGQTVIRKIIKR